MKNRMEELLDSLLDGAASPARRAASQQETSHPPAVRRARPDAGQRQAELTRALLSGAVGEHLVERAMESLD